MLWGWGNRTAAVGAAFAIAASAAGAAAAAAGTPPTPPPNDNRADAIGLGSLPATVTGTTVDATVETSEPYSGCASNGNSVWYELTTSSTPPDRIAVTVAANGDLDAVVDVYIRTRSQNEQLACDETDDQGNAALAFAPKRNTEYLIRVASRTGSVDGTFTLRAFALPPPAQPPGAPLPVHGAGGTLERVVNATAAYSASLAAGTSYRLNLVNRTGRCMRLEVFAPGIRSFDDTPVAALPCAGYRIFTPSESGRFSLLVRASGATGPQRYYLDLAPTTPADSAPGLPLDNNAKVHGFLRGNRIDVVRLFRFDVVDRSNLKLDLVTGDSTPFDLELRDDRGRTISCACGGTGEQTIDRTMRPGRYFVAIRAQNFSSGSFTLTRSSRTITHTSVLIAGSRNATLAPGSLLPITVRLTPGVSGPVQVEIERFDPLSRWQFATVLHLQAVNGAAQAIYTPSFSGRWRVLATFTGTRTASPSQSGYAQALLAGPLTQ